MKNKEHIDSEEKLLKQMREFTGDKSLKFIGLDDSFEFKCQQCGKCCMNRNDIILNPFDIYNGAKYLGITTEEFILRYTHIDLGRESKIPMVTLRSESNGFCPLLKFDVKDGCKFKCIIHEAKPGACSNHPIGVTFETNKDNGDSKRRFIKVQQCENSTSNEVHTVKEWVKPYLDHIDEINIAHQIQTLVTDYFNPKEFYKTVKLLELIADEMTDCSLKKVSEETKNEFIERSKEILTHYVITSIRLGYEYDINKPFIEQAERNMEKLRKFYEQTNKMHEGIKDIVSNLTKSLDKEEDSDGNN